jgi:hypothetical protein
MKEKGLMNTCNATRVTRRAGLAALALLMAAPITLLAAGAPEIAGDWQGKLAVNPTTALTVRFTFTKAANGTYTAVLNSPDNSAVKNTAVSGVTWDGTNLKLAVPTLQGSYAGAMKSGKIVGEWTQPGGKLPLELAPYQKVVLSSDAMKPYLGSWNGTITMAATTQTLAFEFKQGAAGLEGTFSIPDQGLTRPASDVTVENGELSFKVNVGAELSYKGKLTGSNIVGKLKVPSPVAPPDGVDLTLKRGAYQAKPVALKLSAESFAALKGKWQGTGSITNPQTQAKVDFQVTVRFESGSGGEQYGYIDSVVGPQSVKGIVITEATLVAGKFDAKAAAVNFVFTGTVAGKKIAGEITQGNVKTPVELTQTP